MSILYILNTSQVDSLKHCLQRQTRHDALLLIENAVVAVNSGHIAETILSEYINDKNIYALEPDLLARGIQLSEKLGSIQLIDYDGFVTLAVQHQLSCYWK